jgi:hypothetical protein
MHFLWKTEKKKREKNKKTTIRGKGSDVTSKDMKDDQVLQPGGVERTT